MGKKGENREYREEMLAVMEKEVMAVSLLCRELTPTCCRSVNRKCQGQSEKKQVERSGSETELRPAPTRARASSPKLTWNAAAAQINTLSYYPRHFHRLASSILTFHSRLQIFVELGVFPHSFLRHFGSAGQTH